jgi:hypothetical protein
MIFTFLRRLKIYALFVCLYYKEKIFLKMIRSKDLVIMKAVALCIKMYLKPEEAMIYCNLGRTQLAKKCDQLKIVKNVAGYYLRSDLDRIFENAAA